MVFGISNIGTIPCWLPGANKPPPPPRRRRRRRRRLLPTAGAAAAAAAAAIATSAAATRQPKKYKEIIDARDWLVMWVQKGAIQIRGQQLHRSQQGIVGDHQAGRGVTLFYDT